MIAIHRIQVLQLHVLRRIQDVSTADEGVEEITRILDVDEIVEQMRRIVVVVHFSLVIQKRKDDATVVCKTKVLHWSVD